MTSKISQMMEMNGISTFSEEDDNGDNNEL